jgi:polyisoprenoid-binding protein YceI
MRKTILSFALALLLAMPAFAADEFKIDPSHSNIGFTVRHMMVSTVRGQFDQYDGSIIMDQKDPSKSSVNVVIKSASINTSDAKRDDHLRSGDFFESEKFPEITFKSTKVEKRGEQWVAIGDFTMKGVTKRIELPFTLNGPATIGKRTLIGVDATTKLNRKDYNVNWNRALDTGGVAVSDEVQVTLNLEAIKTEPAAKASAN